MVSQKCVLAVSRHRLQLRLICRDDPVCMYHLSVAGLDSSAQPVCSLARRHIAAKDKLFLYHVFKLTSFKVCFFFQHRGVQLKISKLPYSLCHKRWSPIPTKGALHLPHFIAVALSLENRRGTIWGNGVWQVFTLLFSILNC